MVDVSLKGHYLCGQAAARHMAERGGGAIVNISSICDEVAQANYSHYVASKGGVRMLTKAMAMELVEHGIRVNAIAPGPTDTGSEAVKKEYAPIRRKACRGCRWRAWRGRKRWSAQPSSWPASPSRAT